MEEAEREPELPSVEALLRAQLMAQQAAHGELKRLRELGEDSSAAAREEQEQNDAQAVLVTVAPAAAAIAPVVPPIAQQRAESGFGSRLGVTAVDAEDKWLADEEAFLLSLTLSTAGFRKIEVPCDGACMFSSLYVCLKAAQWERAAASGDAGAPRGKKAARRLAESIEQSEGATLALMMRERVVESLRTSKDFRASAAVAVAIARASSDADETTEALAEAASALGDGELNEADAVEAYIRVMSLPHIYGERLELAAAAASLGRPIHVYYHTPGTAPNTQGADEDGVISPDAIDRPTEVFGAHLAVESDGLDRSPLSIFHEVSNRHFSALVPRRGLVHRYRRRARAERAKRRHKGGGRATDAAETYESDAGSVVSVASSESSLSAAALSRSHSRSSLQS